MRRDEESQEFDRLRGLNSHVGALHHRVELPHKRTSAGAIQLYRVEHPGVLKDAGYTQIGETRVIQRGVAESTSLVHPVFYGAVTRQTVPLHRVLATSRRAALGTGTACF
jgi:hypothetical protein